MPEPASGSEEVCRLRRSMRDLVALSTLPTVRTGYAPDAIARSLAEVLLNPLSLDLIYVRLEGLSDVGIVEETLSLGQLDPTSAANHLEVVKAALAPLLGPGRTVTPSSIPDPFGAGALRATITCCGHSGDQGFLVAASRRRGFPTEEERLHLNAVANQTAVVIERRPGA